MPDERQTPTTAPRRSAELDDSSGLKKEALCANVTARN